ncbi:MAG TPA: hypothetical protein VL403_12110 [Candidatus Kryptonia bacterium]|nr:hypothetical protein [Candidatus Kryptonia bacterium]
MRWIVSGIGAALCAIVVVGCTKLPDPDSPGARLYAARCNSCHRVYAPSLLKFEMWKYQVDRMQNEIVRHGLPPLTPDELTTLLDYLKRYSG